MAMEQNEVKKKGKIRANLIGMILHLWVMCFYERAVCVCKKKTHIVVLSKLH